MIKNLLHKYFNKASSPKDKQKAYDELMGDENKFLDHFDEQEWDEFCQNDIEKINEPEYSIKPRLHNVRRIITVAASVIIVISVCSLFYFNNNTTSSKTGNVQNNIEVKEYVSGNFASQITLPDSSLVELKPNSSIKYYTSLYNIQKREIYLKGEAVFKVYKDTSRKFSVYCNGIITTALGTEFIVTDKNKQQITVTLLHGKISVAKSTREINDKVYYLNAGNSIVYNIPNKYFTLNLAQNDAVATADIKKGNIYKPGKVIKQDSVETQLPENLTINKQERRFENNGLGEVLEHLAQKYNTKIIYPTKEVAKINFVGTVRYTEDIQSILKNIALMNNLSIVFDSSKNVYTIY